MLSCPGNNLLQFHWIHPSICENFLVPIPLLVFLPSSHFPLLPTLWLHSFWNLSRLLQVQGYPITYKPIRQYFTLPHSFRVEPSSSERFRVFPIIFQISSECFRAVHSNSEQFRVIPIYFIKIFKSSFLIKFLWFPSDFWVIFEWFLSNFLCLNYKWSLVKHKGCIFLWSRCH